MTAIDLPDFKADDATVIWRYLPLRRFDDLLCGKLYFAAARQFADPFEGAITDAERAWREKEVKRAVKDERVARSWLRDMPGMFEELRRMAKVNCWHAATDENVAMWERYLRDRTSGVAIRSTVGGLKRALHQFHLRPACGEEKIVVGRVRYVDFANAKPPHHTMLETFLYKGVEYRDEREVRAILWLKMAADAGCAIPDDGVQVGVELGELIDEVRVSAAAEPADFDEVCAAVERSRLACTVRYSTLARAPTY